LVLMEKCHEHVSCPYNLTYIWSHRKTNCIRETVIWNSKQTMWGQWGTLLHMQTPMSKCTADRGVSQPCNTGQHHPYYVPWNYGTFKEELIQYRGSVFSSYLLVLYLQCGHGVHSWDLAIYAPESHQTSMTFGSIDIKRHVTESLLETSSLLC
jgi:hypothetical protein